MNKEYAEKVEVLLRLLPIVMDEKVFAVHGGSAINLFVRDLPRYSVDIDLTYIPLEGREESPTGTTSTSAISRITLLSNGNY